jgi:hypothetical protein
VQKLLRLATKPKMKARIKLPVTTVWARDDIKTAEAGRSSHFTG